MEPCGTPKGIIILFEKRPNLTTKSHYFNISPDTLYAVTHALIMWIRL